MCRPDDFPPHDKDRVEEYQRSPLNPTPAEEHELHFEKRSWCGYCEKLVGPDKPRYIIFSNKQLTQEMTERLRNEWDNADAVVLSENFTVLDTKTGIRHGFIEKTQEPWWKILMLVGLAFFAGVIAERLIG